MKDYSEIDMSSQTVDVLIFILSKISVKLIKGPVTDWT